jgi:hypothetical protein
VIKMTAKQPQGGEYWQKGLRRLFIIGTTKNGLTVGETEFGTLIPFMSIHDWQHLPDCDSFEWQPEVYPQYWTAKQTDSNRDVAFVELKQGGDWVQHYRDGGEYLMTVVPFQKKGRTQLTKEQAEALQSPQESPDDWVEITDPEHVRRECDCVAGKTDHPDEWTPCVATVGHSQAAYPESKIRCRRKDLPVVKSPECVAVRLWRSPGLLSVVAADDPPTIHWQEIKHDGYKFYVEEER